MGFTASCRHKHRLAGSASLGRNYNRRRHYTTNRPPHHTLDLGSTSPSCVTRWCPWSGRSCYNSGTRASWIFHPCCRYTTHWDRGGTLVPGAEASGKLNNRRRRCTTNRSRPRNWSHRSTVPLRQRGLFALEQDRGWCNTENEALLDKLLGGARSAARGLERSPVGPHLGAVWANFRGWLWDVALKDSFNAQLKSCKVPNLVTILALLG